MSIKYEIKMAERKGMLTALQGLRVLATLAIFLCHSGFLLNGTFPVTFFFMLSGFVTYYTKSNIVENEGYLIWYRSQVWRKIKEFYPLHIVTFVMAGVIGGQNDSIIAGILDLAMISPFFKGYAIAFNGVSWYLNTTIFLYVAAYWLLRVANKIDRPVLAVIGLISVIIGINLLNDLLALGLYLYSNPFYRIMDFFLGILLGKIFLSNLLPKLRGTKCEFSILIIFILQYAISLQRGYDPAHYTLVFSVGLIVFAYGEGKISKILSANVFQKLSAYCFPFFMVHELALRIFRKVFAGISCPYIIRLLIISVPGFLLTIVLVLGYKRLELKIKRLRRKVSNENKT